MPSQNGVVDRPWVVGREFESHVHIETRFLKKSEFAHVNNLKNASGSCDGLKATNQTTGQVGADLAGSLIGSL